MKNVFGINKKSLTLLAALGLTAGFGLTGCDVDVDDSGELPSVDVDVDGDAGEMPDVDVKGPEVEYETKEVEVPVGIDVPEENEVRPEDRTE